LIALENMILTCIILAIFRKKIQAFYGKIEMSFLTNFNERDSATINLTPWDTHITKFELNAQSPYIGKSLFESRMREEFGVNIVAIERGDFMINVPNRDNHLYPDDKISVIGTDEQLSNFKIFLESSAPQIEDVTQNISLHHFTISKNSALVGQSIRESGIRERTQGLIVGIERNGERILNPESNVIFEPEDKVWLVANEKRIQRIIRELSAQF